MAEGNEGLNIYRLDDGTTLVGIGAQDPDDYATINLTYVAIIRYWGTTAGLGQLALEGPQSKTKLDPEPPGSFNRRYLRRRIRCHHKPWEVYLHGHPDAVDDVDGQPA